MAAPKQSVYVRIKPKKTDERWGMSTSASVLKGQAPPQDLQVKVFEFDRRVLAVVRDHENKPIANATVLSTYGETTTDEAGEAELRHSSFFGQIQAFARAPSFAQQELWIEIHEDGQTIEFQLHPELTISGKVVDQNDIPIQGARLHAFGVQKNYVLSLADGTFALNHIDPDNEFCFIYAEKEGYLLGRADFNPKSGSVTNHVFVLYPGAELSGKLSDPSGGAIEGASLSIGRNSSSFERIDTHSDATGLFQFPNVPPGGQLLHINAEKFSPQVIELSVPEDAGSMPFMNVTLDRGSFIAGTVTDPAGNPVAEAYLSVRNQASYTGKRVQTDEGGKFRLESVPKDGFTLEIYHVVHQRKKIELTATDLNQDDLIIVLDPIGRIAGKVVDGQTGMPLTSFNITFLKITHPEKGPRGMGISGEWARDGKLISNSNGIWDSANAELPLGGQVTTRISAPGFAPVTSDPITPSAEPNPDDFIVSLYPSSKLTGTVIAESNRTPIANCKVYLLTTEQLKNRYDEQRDAIPIGTTNKQGEYTLENFSPGEYWLRASHFDFATSITGPIAISTGDVSAPTIELGAGASISGTVARQDGTPWTDATMRITGEQLPGVPRYRREVTSDQNGAFEFTKLTDGNYRVDVQKIIDGYEVALIRVSVEIQDHQSQFIEMVSTGFGSVKGSVVWGLPFPPGISVILNPLFDPELTSASEYGSMQSYYAALVQNEFYFPMVQPGKYKILCIIFDSKLDDPIVAQAEKEVVVKINTESSVDLVLE
ncbi:MAG: carboxypeptidase regulatory-like domain-containing protein [Planctomycetes bacterium]|nr:carboxypeptidase regulatory-like domain-containing protein [Planctomycetota bacterium]